MKKSSTIRRQINRSLCTVAKTTAFTLFLLFAHTLQVQGQDSSASDFSIYFTNTATYAASKSTLENEPFEAWDTIPNKGEATISGGEVRYFGRSNVKKTDGTIITENTIQIANDGFAMVSDDRYLRIKLIGTQLTKGTKIKATFADAEKDGVSNAIAIVGVGVIDSHTKFSHINPSVHEDNRYLILKTTDTWFEIIEDIRVSEFIVRRHNNSECDTEDDSDGLCFHKNKSISLKSLKIIDCAPCEELSPVLTVEASPFCSGKNEATLSVTNYEQGATLTLYNTDGKKIGSSVIPTATATTHTFQINISETATYYVIADNTANGGCVQRSNEVKISTKDDIRLLKPLFGPELTYIPDIIRRQKQRIYTNDDVMPLALLTIPEEMNPCVTDGLNYDITLTYTKADPQYAGRVFDFNIKDDWIYPDEKRSNDDTTFLVANFAKLREAILESKYNVITDTTTNGCSTETHLHPGAVIHVNISVKTPEGEEMADLDCPIRISDKYRVCYIVRGGTFEGDFYDVLDEDLYDDPDDPGKKRPKGTWEDLQDEFDIVPVSCYAKFDSINYNPFDLLIMTDYPRAGETYYEKSLGEYYFMKQNEDGIWEPTDERYYPELDKNASNDYKFNGTTSSAVHPFYINKLAKLVDKKPIFSWKAYLSANPLTEWTKLGFTGSPYHIARDYYDSKDEIEQKYVRDKLMQMRIVCDHAVLRGLEALSVKDEDGYYTLTMLEHLANETCTKSDESDDCEEQYLKMHPDSLKSTYGVQGYDSLNEDNFVVVAYMDLPDIDSVPLTQKAKNNYIKLQEEKISRLYACVERQANINARMMICGIYSIASSYLNDNGKSFVKNAINYLLDAAPAHVEDCAITFDNGYDYIYTTVGDNIEDVAGEYVVNERKYDEETQQYTDEKKTKTDVAEFIAQHTFPVKDEDGNDIYRVRFTRDDYADKFNQDVEEWKNNHEGKKYPFEPHDNKWRNKANWIQYILPTANHNVRLRSAVELDSATYEVKDVRINDRVSHLTIKPTGGLKASGSFTHYNGMVSYNKRYPIDTCTLIDILANKDHTGMLAHQHYENGSPLYATVELYSAAHYEYEKDANGEEIKDPVNAYKWWTYFGMPVQSGTVPDIFNMAYTYEWDESINDWHRRGDGKTLTSWKGYALSQKEPETFTLPGQLEWADDNLVIPLSRTKWTWTDNEKTKGEGGAEGANIIGYSWTAPLHLNTIRFPKEYETYDAQEHDLQNVEPKVYIYITGRDKDWWKETDEYGTVENTHDRPYFSDTVEYTLNDREGVGYWYPIPLGPTAMDEWPADLKVVPAMQAFLVQAEAAGSTEYYPTNEDDKNIYASVRLDYKRMVYDPVVVDQTSSTEAQSEETLNNRENNTPRKVSDRSTDTDQPLLMRIMVTNGYTIEEVFLIEHLRFTEGLDRGWEAEYTETGTYGLWAYSSAGNLSTAAFPTLDGRVLGFKAAKDDEYQFSFGDWKGDKLYLNDSKMRRSTVITKSQTYRFEASKDDETNRFFISSVPYDIQTPTGVEDLVVADGELQVNNPTGERLTVTVYDAAGRMFSRTVTTDPLTQVNLPEGATGVYLVSVEGQQNSFVRKVIR